jgi:hypothetical protein
MNRKIRTGVAAGMAMLGVAAPGQAQAQPAPLPVTRILAIGTVTPGVDRASVRAILPNEVSETVKLYLAGKIDQWFSRADGNGVVFVLNVTDPEEAHEMLEALPLGKAHLMTFDLMPLTPLAPMRVLPGLGADAGR